MSYFRNEFKYLVSEQQIAMLSCRLDGVLSADVHAGGKEAGDRKQYLIRSLYFDDPQNSCFYDNESGYDRREKWRIRTYNASAKTIYLEKKSKLHGKTHKDRCLLTREQAERLILGEGLPQEPEDGLLKEFSLLQRTKGFMPKVITVYERVPYVYALGNVRITFDRNISSSVDYGSFFAERLPVRPVMQAGAHLMEVKYDEYLPSFIFQCLQMQNLQRTAFSKYCLCRKYSLVLASPIW